MNRIMKWGLVGIVGITCYSCGSDNLYDPEKADELKLARYEKAFVAKYGEIAPDQDWGFGSTEIARANTRGGDMDGKFWWKTIDYNAIPASVTLEEEAKVLAVFENLPKDVKSVSINWSDYFIQQVHKGTDKYTDGNNQSTNTGSSYMNNLSDGTEVKIGDFNGGEIGQTTDIWEKENDNECKRKNEKGICLVQGGNTAYFGYENSFAGDNKIYNNKNCGKTISIIQKIDGAYYVGLQFIAEGQNPNQKAEGNGKFTDWILKITPAKYKNARRIMAEDLALTTGDFDFNDVVFDAAKVDDDYVITLHAAGGTLPLYIEDQEVHGLFGVPTTTMVNTQPGMHHEMAPVVFRLKNKQYTNLHDIPITVEGQEGKIELVANIGEAPGKLCAPVTEVENKGWADETQGIDDKLYTSFKENIKTPGKNWWE